MNGTLLTDAIRKTLTVSCSVEEAFRVYTAGADTWWPIETHSIHGERVREVVFEEREGGEVYEVTHTGERAHWATVRAWEPPSRLVLAWEVTPGVLGTEIEVRFAPEGDGTRVELEHRGWDVLAEGAAEMRADYETGWDFVLGQYVDRIG